MFFGKKKKDKRTDADVINEFFDKIKTNGVSFNIGILEEDLMTGGWISQGTGMGILQITPEGIILGDEDDPIEYGKILQISQTQKKSKQVETAILVDNFIENTRKGIVIIMDPVYNYHENLKMYNVPTKSNNSLKIGVELINNSVTYHTAIKGLIDTYRGNLNQSLK